jgi:hypothetical protein
MIMPRVELMAIDLDPAQFVQIGGHTDRATETDGETPGDHDRFVFIHPQAGQVLFVTHFDHIGHGFPGGLAIAVCEYHHDATLILDAYHRAPRRWARSGVFIVHLYPLGYLLKNQRSLLSRLLDPEEDHGG